MRPSGSGATHISPGAGSSRGGRSRGRRERSTTPVWAARPNAADPTKTSAAASLRMMTRYLPSSVNANTLPPFTPDITAMYCLPSIS